MATPGFSRFLVLGFLAAAVLQAHPAHAGEAVGEAVSISTQVAGQTGALARGDSIYRDERIRSNASGVGAFMFVDGTKLAVGPNSTVVIDQYVYAGGDTVKKLAIGATKGTLRWISGKSDHSAYKIVTPSGTLGVRGTAFDIYIGRDGTTAVTLLNGAAQFCNGEGCRTLNRRCEFIIAKPGRRATEPRGVTRDIGLGVSGAQAFPFLVGKARLPRGFEAGTRCSGLTAFAAGSRNNDPGGGTPRGPSSSPGSGGGDNGGGDNGGGDNGGGTDGGGTGGGTGPSGGTRGRGGTDPGTGGGFTGGPGTRPDPPSNDR